MVPPRAADRCRFVGTAAVGLDNRCRQENAMNGETTRSLAIYGVPVVGTMITPVTTVLAKPTPLSRAR
jgi:hypothetical protein